MVDNAATDIVAPISLSLLSILLGVRLEVKLLDRMLILRLIFWVAAILFFTVAAQFHIPVSQA